MRSARSETGWPSDEDERTSNLGTPSERRPVDGGANELRLAETGQLTSRKATGPNLVSRMGGDAAQQSSLLLDRGSL